jgi:hypothetical protein
MRVRGTSIALILTVNKSIKLLQVLKGQANRVKGIIKGVKGAKGTKGVKIAKAKREESY